MHFQSDLLMLILAGPHPLKIIVMKKFLLLSFILTQCSAPTTDQIKTTSIDPEDTGDQIIELTGYPFDILVPQSWTYNYSGNTVELLFNDAVQLSISGKADKILENSEIIPSIDNMEINSFCFDTNCVIQMDKEGLFQAKVHTKAGFKALEHLR